MRALWFALVLCLLLPASGSSRTMNRRERFEALEKLLGPGKPLPPLPFEPVDPGPVVSPRYGRGSKEPVNDPFFVKEWWLSNTGQADDKGQVGLPGADMGGLAAWALIQPAKPMLLAILDSGLDLSHEDIDPACLWTNPGETGADEAGHDKATNGKDDDNNGYVDDVHGYNFVHNNAQVQEDQWHGTHLGGLVGASLNNGKGIAGAYPPVKIMLVKIFGNGHLLSSEEIGRAVRYAVDNGAKVLSNSYGTPSYVEDFKKVIEYTESKGALFVCAAGNSRKNLDKEDDHDYPSCYGVANQLVVGATDNRDESARFSNYGQVVDIAAPGQAMFSLWPGGKYSTFSGTSMACPLAAGAAALLWSQHPDWTYAQVKAQLIVSADKRERLKRWVKSAGRLDIAKALKLQSGDQLPQRDFTNWKEKPFSAQTPHPYTNDHTQQSEINIPEAQAFRIHFSRFITDHEDFLLIQEGDGRRVEVLEGDWGDTWSEVISGSSAKLTFTATEFINEWGFAIDKVQYQPRWRTPTRR